MEAAATRTLPSKRTGRSLSRIILLIGLTVVLALVLLYLGISVAVADKLSRPKREPVLHTPAEVSLPYESIQFQSDIDNIPLKGWYIRSSGKRAIILLHGLDGNRSSGDGALPLARAFVDDGYDVLMFDFRGHGESSGERFSLGKLEPRDLAGALKFVQGRGVEKIGTLGWSLGALTELNAAPDHPEMRAIVADSAIADVTQLLELHFTERSGLPSFLIPGVLWTGNVLYGIDLASDVPVRQFARLKDRPLLLIHGTDDDLMPVSNAYTFQAAAADDPNFQLWIVPGTCHTCAYTKNPAEYVRRVRAFFDQNLR